MMSCRIRSRSVEETESLGRRVGEWLDFAPLVLLRGGLGAGKTAFVRGLAQGLGVADDEPVTSPTYALMNHYRGRFDLYHFDLYRLSGLADLDEIGFDEVLKSGGAVVVEWSERIGASYPADLSIAFASGVTPEERLIEFATDDARFVPFIDRLTSSNMGVD